MKAAQRGFTLIELLISVILLALLTGMLFASLRVGTHHLGAQAERLDRGSRIALAQKFLRAQLADARPLYVPGTSAQEIFFDGRPDGVGFVNPAPEAIAAGGLQSLTIDMAPGKGGGQLVAEWHSFDGTGADGAKDGRRSVLLDGIAQAQIAYFGSLRPDEAPDWHPAWRDLAYLPSLVRLSVIFSDGESMPELIVALRLAPAAKPAGAPANGRS